MNDIGRPARRVPPLLAILVLIAALAGVSGDSSAQSERRPLTFEQVVKLLEEGVPDAEIQKHVEEYRVDFGLNTEDSLTLFELGASRELIRVIENSRHSELVITSPRDGSNCGATERVEGKSTVPPDKHLWIFAHRQGLRLWWPQVGEVRVEEDGTWKQTIFVGQPQDIGFDFEITARWVDSRQSTDLEGYLQRGETAGYPGLPLPEGAPTATVICSKVSH